MRRPLPTSAVRINRVRKFASKKEAEAYAAGVMECGADIRVYRPVKRGRNWYVPMLDEDPAFVGVVRRARRKG